jgi:hypothetical protein
MDEIINAQNLPSPLKMQSVRTRTSLGRSPLGVNLGLPPSPQAEYLSQQGSSIPSLSNIVNRQTPRASQSVVFTSEAIPGYGEEEFFEERASVPSLVKSKSLDDELTRAGYTPVSKMVVVSPQGEPQVKFIKAQSKFGQPLYIAVDVNDSYVAHSTHDPKFRLSHHPIATISSQEKELAYSKAGLQVSGVAFECKHGLCTVMHDEQFQEPHEQNFVLMHTKKVEETLVLASFPIVKMSEVRCNPQTICKHADQCLRKMRNAALHKCLCDIKITQEKFDKFCCLFKETLAAKDKVIREFDRTINLLEDNYAKCCQCPEKYECKIKEIAYNIEKRNAKFPALIQTCKEIAALQCVMDEINAKLYAAKCKLEKKFKYLHCAYELKEHKRKHACRCAWEEQDYSSDEE